MNPFASKLLAAMPLLWVAMPMVAGILASHSTGSTWPMWIAIAFAGTGAVALRFWARTPARRLKTRLGWTAVFVTIFFALGFARATIDSDTPIPESETQQTALAHVTDVTFRDFSMRVEANLLRIGNHAPKQCRILINTQGCDYSLKAGTRIVFAANLQPIQGLGNPDEIDHARSLWQRHINYVQHAPASELRNIGFSPTLLDRSRNLNRDLRQVVRNTSLPERCQTLLIALLLGNDLRIDNNLRTSFSHAGIAHVLALSGLHMGIVAGLFYLLLFPLDYLRLRRLRLTLTIVMMWLFALLTGMSPSVARAATMTSFVMLSLMIHRKNSALNTLMIAAILLMLIEPRVIYNAGFQLSFITVAAIVALHDNLPQPSRKHHFRYRILSTLAISAIALLVTLGLTAYYFNTISWASVLTNLLVLPVLPVLISAGLLWLIAAIAGTEWLMLNRVVEWLADYLETVADTIARWPVSHSTAVYFDGIDTLIYYLIVSLILLRIGTRNRWFTIGAIAATAMLIGHFAWQRSHTPRQGIFILNDFRTTPILAFRNHTAALYIPDRERPDAETFQMRHRRMLAHYQIDTVQVITDPQTVNSFILNPPMAFLNGVRIATFSRSGTIYPDSTQQIDIAVIGRGFTDSIATIRRHWQVRRIVVGGGVSGLRQDRLRQESDTAVWFLCDRGAWQYFP